MGKADKSLLDLIYVPRCAGCGERMEKIGNGICENCFERYEDEKAKYCDFCGMEVHICTCLPKHFVENCCMDYRKLVFYYTYRERNIISPMIFSVKRQHNLPLIRFFAKELAQIDNFSDSNIIVSYVPRSRKAYKEYGYDQGKLLAEEYAKAKDLDLVTVFKRKLFHIRKEQKLLNYKQRAANIRGAFKIARGVDVTGKIVVLVDDVVTSGSTIGECVSMLYRAGARNVICRSVAYTYRKNKSKKD